MGSLLGTVIANAKNKENHIIERRDPILDYQILISLLKQEVKPAVGCTEPAAVALAVARAVNLLSGKINRVSVKVSPNIYKNAMSVTIPNTGETGLDMASALGMLLRNPEKELELFDAVRPDDIQKAHQILKKGNVKVELAKVKGFYIQAKVEGEMGWAEVYVAGSHTNMIKAVVNDNTVFLKDGQDVEMGLETNIDVTSYTISDFIKTIETIPIEDISFLQEGIDMNLNISRKGLELQPGLGVSVGLKKLVDRGVISNDIINKVRIAVAAACDARMAGLNFPVMTTMGSGNHGIEAIIPVAIVAQEIQAPQEKALRALALSHLVTAYVKQYTGKLSSLCGCTIAAGTGAAAAITWLLGGSLRQIEGAIKNVIGNLTGMICDGAKGGCALKLTTAAGEAIIAAYLALQDIIISSRDGIISQTCEETIKNLGEISSKGMANTDEVILGIMLSKQKQVVS